MKVDQSRKSQRIPINHSTTFAATQKTAIVKVQEHQIFTNAFGLFIYYTIVL